MENLKSGMLFENEFTNIFIKYVNYTDKIVKFIEGFSPSAIHDLQAIPFEQFKEYTTKYGFKQTGYWE